MLEGLRIGELAARAGVSTDTVRFYEREGLLPRPRRNAAKYRIYGEEAAERLRARIGAVDRQMALLQDFRQQLAESLARCENADSEACPVVLDLATPMIGKRRGR